MLSYHKASERKCSCSLDLKQIIKITDAKQKPDDLYFCSCLNETAYNYHIYGDELLNNESQWVESRGLDSLNMQRHLHIALNSDYFLIRRF